MGFIYIIENNVNKMKYVGQTIRNPEIRWQEHKVTSKNRLINNAIKEFGEHNFSFLEKLEVDNAELDIVEIKLIKEYDTLYPKGYNNQLKSTFTKEDNILGGSSSIGHDKQSLKTKEKYKTNDTLKNLGDIPRGISYWKGDKKGYFLHGFKVRKVGIKNKEFMTSGDNIEKVLEKAKKYILLNE